MKMMRFPNRYATLAAAAISLVTLSAAAVAQEQDVALRQGAGQEVVAQNCGGCHSLDYIPMNGFFLKDEAWKAEVGKMRKVFGAPITDPDAETITRYLAEQYSATASP